MIYNLEIPREYRIALGAIPLHEDIRLTHKRLMEYFHNEKLTSRLDYYDEYFGEFHMGNVQTFELKNGLKVKIPPDCENDVIRILITDDEDKGSSDGPKKALEFVVEELVKKRVPVFMSRISNNEFQLHLYGAMINQVSNRKNRYYE